MTSSLVDALRFARGWTSPRGDLVERETWFPPADGSDPVPGTLVEPPLPRPLPSWVVLHGITRPGRNHPALRRFVAALASTRARVLVPEIDAWTELRFAPDRAQAVIRGAVRRLAGSPRTLDGRVTLAGFSFGGPQALLAAADPEVRADLRAVLGWGSYADLRRLFRFHLGVADGADGAPALPEPDPYGRWVVGANCLTLAPEYEDAEDVARALRALAAVAGDRQIPSADPSMDPVKVRLRGGVDPQRRELFDLFTPPAGTPFDHERGRPVVEAMAEATVRRLPLMDPVPLIERIDVPVRLLHGRDDALIPFTETLDLRQRLEGRTPDLATGITGLFQHSGGENRPPGRLARLRANAHFLKVLGRVFEVA